jgi:riboflavin synthase
MFTGLIESIGTIARRDDLAGGARLEVTAPFAAELTHGESVAVNGVCLTAIDLAAGSFAAELSPETLRATSLGGLATGSHVNLERAVRADARLGGHFVLGHVDTIARILKWESQGDHWWLELELPKAIEMWVVEKGSVAIDGVSLTIARLRQGSGGQANESSIGIQIVPHTRSHTNLSTKRPGDVVNVEADIIGKYAARLAGLTRQA